MRLGIRRRAAISPSVPLRTSEDESVTTLRAANATSGAALVAWRFALGAGAGAGAAILDGGGDIYVGISATADAFSDAYDQTVGAISDLLP
jgi:hypothetical protein